MELLTGYGLFALVAVLVTVAVLGYFWLGQRLPFVKSKASMEIMAMLVDFAIAATEEWKVNYQGKVKGVSISADEATSYCLTALDLLAKPFKITVDKAQAEVLIRAGLLKFNGQEIGKTRERQRTGKILK